MENYHPLIKILIYGLDDDPLFLKAIEFAFKANGIENYKLFTDDEIMIEELNEDVQICIIDYHLNRGYNGVDVMRKIRELQPLCTFIFMSNQHDMDVVIDIMNEGGSYYIRKDRKDFEQKLIQYVTLAAKECDCQLRETLKVASRLNETIEIFENYKNGRSKV